MTRRLSPSCGKEQAAPALGRAVPWDLRFGDSARCALSSSAAAAAGASARRTFEGGDGRRRWGVRWLGWRGRGPAKADGATTHTLGPGRARLPPPAIFRWGRATAARLELYLLCEPCVSCADRVSLPRSVWSCVCRGALLHSTITHRVTHGGIHGR